MQRLNVIIIVFKVMGESMTNYSRRKVLRAAGISLALHMLESLQAAVKPSLKTSFDPKAKAKRMVCIGTYLGYVQDVFYPKEEGKNYNLSPHLSNLSQHKDDFTVFSGLDHRAGSGHGNWDNFLCGADIGSVSLDQLVAESLSTETRIHSLQLCAGGLLKQNMSYTKNRVPLPMLERPSVIYKKMFASEEDRRRTDYLLESGKSSLDTVLDEAKSLQREVSRLDKERLDEYFTSLREVEKRMTRQIEHLKKPRPSFDYELPPYDPVSSSQMLEAEAMIYDLIALAFQTDSTRVATLFLSGKGQVHINGSNALRAGYHALSHHGNDPAMIKDLLRIETEHLKSFDSFLTQLKTKKDALGKGRC